VWRHGIACSVHSRWRWTRGQLTPVASAINGGVALILLGDVRHQHCADAHPLTDVDLWVASWARTSAINGWLILTPRSRCSSAANIV